MVGRVLVRLSVRGDAEQSGAAPVGVDPQTVLRSPCSHRGHGSLHCRTTGKDVRIQKNKCEVVSVNERRRKVNAVQAAQQTIHVAVEVLRPHHAALGCHG
ncbi:hypothetical protein TcCL_NonESM12499 [Trypanosoma cruzi]|nr:hypothetical protein TcCL_NonESM12499 [Trypanosoma cruzi]